MFDQSNPLKRIEGETRLNNDVLRDYFGMGQERSLQKLADKYSEIGVKRSESVLRKWSIRFQWQARVTRQKELDDAIQDNARAEQLDTAARQIITNRLSDYETIRKSALARLAFPAIRKVVETNGDQEITIIEPVDIGDEYKAVKMLLDADELMCRALGLPLTHKTTDITSGGKPLQFTSDDFSDSKKRTEEYEKRLLESGNE